MLLYIGCFSNADDDGRLHADPAFLKAEIFRYRNVTERQISDALVELAKACSAFCLYENRGNSFVAFLNWGDWQKPKYPRPSRLPPPPKRAITAYLRGKSSGKPSGTVPEHVPNVSGNDSPVGWVGLGSTPLPPSEEKSKPRAKGTNPRARRTNPRAQTGVERHVIGLRQAWSAFVAGAGWDETYDESMIDEELERIRSGAYVEDDGYSRAEAVDLWRSERDRRYAESEVPV
jgi:hypothetical protein